MASRSMRSLDFTMTGSIGSRWRALLDDTVVPMPERLTVLLEEIEGGPKSGAANHDQRSELKPSSASQRRRMGRKEAADRK